jgi:phage anti-repressor protein
LYIVSFYSYLNYDEFTDFVVDLDDVWKWLGFSQKSNAKVVLTKNFKENIDYKFLLMQLHEPKKDGRGGHNKETVLLNINTFKLLCLKADTEKARQIHKYYVRLESILHQTIKEESEEFKNQVLMLEKDKQKLVIDKSLEKHNLLLKEYGTSTPLIYLARIKTFDNKTIGLKIGETRQGVMERYVEHKSKYEECVIMDCF